MNLYISPEQDIVVKIVFAIRKPGSTDSVRWREILQDKEKEFLQVGTQGMRLLLRLSKIYLDPDINTFLHPVERLLLCMNRGVSMWTFNYISTVKLQVQKAQDENELVLPFKKRQGLVTRKNANFQTQGEGVKNSPRSVTHSLP